MRILCLGDSLTYGYRLRRAHTWPHMLEELAGQPVDNGGVNGDTTIGMLARFAARDPHIDYTHLIVMGGGNDLIMGQDPRQAIVNLKTIVYQAVQERMQVTVGIPVKPEKQAPVFPLFPRERYPILEEGRAVILKEMTEFCESGGLCKVVDFQEFVEGNPDAFLDGLHLNEQGNRRVAEGLAAYFRK